MMLRTFDVEDEVMQWGEDASVFVSNYAKLGSSPPFSLCVCAFSSRFSLKEEVPFNGARCNHHTINN